MFDSKELNDHLRTSSTIKSRAAVIAEWNMNFFENIADIGNYRYRPLLGVTQKYGSIPNIYDPRDLGNFYTGATDADVVIDGGFEEDGQTPVVFKPKKEKEKLLFSLEDCFGKFRPRSGINKLRYGITGKYLHHSNVEMFSRPRYYMPDKNDNFKYWTSYRTEDGKEYGIANNTVNGEHYIEDVAPYVVYKEEIPINRIVMKMQTNVGDINLGPFSGASGIFADPFFGEQNKTTPVKWKVQYLKNNTWVDAISFDKNSVRKNGNTIIGTDGYLEIGYGLIVPDRFRANFINNGVIASTTMLPVENENGQAYLVKQNTNDIGQYYIWENNSYLEFSPQYGWYVIDENVDQLTNFVTDTTNPKKYNTAQAGILDYEEFLFISGIRLVVETMNCFGSTLDLIEICPRLTVDLTEKTVAYSITKNASDLGMSGLPVGQLLASTGDLSLFDYDQSFNPNNQWRLDPETNTYVGSIVAKYINKNIQIKFYEIISDVAITDSEGNIIKKSFYVPIKTLYSESFPQTNLKTRELKISLRDLFFYFEAQSAPQLLIPNVSLSFALATIFDSIGFSNYSFKRLDGESDPIIPYFFVSPDKSIAEVLNDLAVATQTAMYFDEYNNFVMMSKNYSLPTEEERPTDLILLGSNTDPKLTTTAQILSEEPRQLENIIDIASQDNSVYNDGKISYIARYIQKSMGSLKQAYVADKNISWIYKPALLWEVSGTENLKPTNGQTATGNKYALAAIPLNSDLSAEVPKVVNHEIVDNIIDFGDGILYIGRYNGYFYSNGEVIRYDAVEYNVSVLPSSVTNSSFTGGNVWISSPQEYEDYFSKLSFNGKIYPTGRARIYAEPNYETFNGITRMSNGEVAKHGRGQFGTKTIDHVAGLNPYWTDNQNVYGCKMKSAYLFGNLAFEGNTSTGKAGVSKSLATKASRSSVIKNYLSFSHNEETSNKNKLSSTSETVQASALVFNGPSFGSQETPIDFISYVNKPLNDSFKHFGTRMRIVGKLENNEKSVQTPAGATTYFSVPTTTPDESKTISGGSGGIATLLNPENNNGYYFEIAALSEKNIDLYKRSNPNIKKNITRFHATSATVAVVYVSSAATSYPVGSKVVISSGKIAASSPVNLPTYALGTWTVTAATSTTITIAGSGFTVANTTGINQTENIALAPATFSADGVSNIFFYKLLQNTSYDIRTPLRDATKAPTPTLTSLTLDNNLPGVATESTITSSANSKLILPSSGLAPSIVQAGQRVLLRGQTIAAQNGYYKLTNAGEFNRPIIKTGNKTFTITVPGVSTEFPSYVSGGKVKKFNSDGSSSTEFIIDEVTVAAATIDTTTITYKTTANHDFSTGNSVVITGITPSVYNLAAPSKWILTRDEDAIPVRLWSGLSSIIVDDGNFAGQSRVIAEEYTTVYDLAIDYEDLEKSRRFYLYLNDTQIAVVDDPNPLPLNNANNMALFVRGASHCMFENVYALANNYSQNSDVSLGPIANEIFTNKTDVASNEAFRKYSINGIVQPTFLSGINPAQPPQYNIFYEEFGSILREMAYFNIKYDKAYPALYSMISPTFNKLRGYTVSGFFGGAYGAEFLIFNATDTFLFLDETVGNYLRIQGITFTQDSRYDLTVDNYFEKTANFANPQIKEDMTILSPVTQKELYKDIKTSRITYGRNEFFLDSIYIQSADAANNLMKWVISKIMKPRKSVGVNIFANPTIQLGDIVSIDYSDSSDEVAFEPEKRFVVYSIDYAKDSSGPSMSLYLSEV
jgi:hypothetical protein